ncbi:hypothetical protein [Paracraurococcus lichenis]|uniref:Uncharacterized protein n=1 Tax=Paracraurococcus lichenis TaxID=3064888 RepID=A0ABT9E7B9_9PROT|nr:hypothetical protein [Paracraurococcus sp. LOR1-02]MDO9711987.1 hypothetical protein [Paracraurococcus sp. LOR1-02]
MTGVEELRLQGFLFIVRATLEVAQMQEMMMWLHEHAPGDACGLSPSETEMILARCRVVQHAGNDPLSLRNTIHVGFFDAGHAALFKLTWVGL